MLICTKTSCFNNQNPLYIRLTSKSGISVIFMFQAGHHNNRDVHHFPHDTVFNPYFKCSRNLGRHDRRAHNERFPTKDVPQLRCHLFSKCWIMVANGRITLFDYCFYMMINDTYFETGFDLNLLIFFC